LDMTGFDVLACDIPLIERRSIADGLLGPRNEAHRRR
jgi:hypothetical protein